jgi:Ran GTPase-activating protein (RanGAP) involved in mRNA processing and transport
MIPLNTLSVNLFIEIINSGNQIGDEGASKLGAGLSNLKDLSNLNLHLG